MLRCQGREVEGAARLSSKDENVVMNADLGALCIAAVSIAFFHTLYGPDHYLPFVAMSRVGDWSLRKTVTVTLLCGVGHVASSVVLGFIGIAFGVVVLQLETLESLRGDLAGWLLLAFGLTYFTWGVVRAIRNQPHTHLHLHLDGTVHVHEHVHSESHLHLHSTAPVEEVAAQPVGGAAAAIAAPRKTSLTPWVLLTIFVFGPCEPLIPLLMYPAAKANTLGVVCVTALFGLTTLATMTGMVVLMCAGAGAMRFERLHRYSHALAGLVVMSCGAAIKLGL
jgi:sulfite exporter TauE/SafE